jgi:hypothetical protein
MNNASTVISPLKICDVSDLLTGKKVSYSN